MSSMQGDSKQSMTSKSEHAMINVQGLCEMCKERIEKAAKGVNGVTSASWDQKTKQLHLTSEPVKNHAGCHISKAVAKVGLIRNNTKQISCI